MTFLTANPPIARALAERSYTEATPVQEAAGLQDDLRRAGIEPFGWIVNATLSGSGTHDPLLLRRALLEQRHLQRIREQLAARAWRIPWRVRMRRIPMASFR